MTPIKQWLEQADATWAPLAAGVLADPHSVDWRRGLDALTHLAVSLGVAPTELAAESVIHRHLLLPIGSARYGALKSKPIDEDGNLWKERARLAAADLEAKKWTVQ